MGLTVPKSAASSSAGTSARVSSRGGVGRGIFSKTLSKEGIFFSMMGHSSSIRMPSIRMLSAAMGVTFSRSYSTASWGSKL